MLTIFIVLIIFSAFFSGLETALFHLRPNSNVNNSVKKLLKNPQQLLASLLTGNTIVNIGLGSIAASYTLFNYNNGSLFPNLPLSIVLLIEVVVVTIIILIFGEIVPKTYAISKSEKMSNFLAKTLKIVLTIIYPVTFVFYKITKLIISLIPIKKEQIFDSEEELIMLAEVGEEEGTL